MGATSSGKTTLAQELGRRLGLPAIEMDAPHWEPGWREAEPKAFRQRVADDQIIHPQIVALGHAQGAGYR